jgi:hypothetical protein
MSMILTGSVHYLDGKAFASFFVSGITIDSNGYFYI